MKVPGNHIKDCGKKILYKGPPGKAIYVGALFGVVMSNPNNSYEGYGKA